MKRKGAAVWKGDLKGGNGTVSTESGILSATPYSFSTRFEQGKGTNPEELIAAAHAGCFSMAFSVELEKMKCTPTSISTGATVHFENLDGQWQVTRIHLDVAATVPGCDNKSFSDAAKNAKEGCPISRLLNAEITMDARLES